MAHREWTSAPPRLRPAPPESTPIQPPKPKIELDPVQAKVLGEVLPKSFMITGPAGTGKSVLAGEIIEQLRARKKSVFVTASTGIAAIHVGGCTIHSFLGTAIHGSIADVMLEPWSLNTQAEYRLKRADVIVVDEVSMLTGDYIDMMDWRLRTVCASDAPFAGKQILFFGDFLQLPPVVKGQRVERTFAFQADAWEKASVQTRVLTVNHRQGDDAEFSRHLNKMRVGDFDRETSKFFNECVGRRVRKPIILYPTNASVDAVNNAKLAKVKGEARVYEAELRGDERACAVLVKNCIASRDLRLKVGAQVLMIKNCYAEGNEYMNGERGVLEDMGDDRLTIRLETEGNPRSVTVEREFWEWKNADREVIASMRQFPAKLGYAITIHKCVAPDTLVDTDLGLQPFSDIGAQGTVATWKGRMVYKNLVRNPKRRAYRITTQHGYELTVTPEHKMMARDGQRWSEVPALDLMRGDILRLRRGHPARGWCGSPDNGHQELPRRPAADPRCKSFMIPSRMTSSLAEFLGLMVADGTVHKGGFRLAKRYIDVTDRFARLGNHLFWLQPHYGMTLGTPHVEFNSTAVVQWLLELGGLAPKKKAVPWCILRASLREQRAFLRGLFEDGSVHTKCGHFSNIEWSTSSEKMGRTVQTMLLRLGMVAARRHVRNGWRLYISGQDAARFRDTVGFVCEAKQQKLAGAGSRHKERRVRFNAIIEDPIESIQEVQSESMCVTVPELHRFLQNGFDGCNSQGMTLERMKCDLLKVFAPGQAYVAVSRAKNAQHLSLDNPINKAQVFVDATCRAFYKKARPKARRIG
jgi:hypothetical protein